jgi:HAD superfamily hydrolase (TIGR01509 family)
MKFKAVIFDLDGTITKPTLDFDAIKHEIGMKDMSMPLLEAMDKMSEFERIRAEEIILRHESLAANNSTLNDNAAETLEAISARGLKIGILTRNIAKHAEIVAQKHNLKFDLIVDRFTGPVKPDPFGVLHICRHFGIIPAQAVVVGDYLFDILSAKSAGSVAILLKNNEDSDEFAKHADYTIDNLSLLLPIIDQNGD